jgi:glycosyltransferase involved in cell wall biosynthesis
MKLVIDAVGVKFGGGATVLLDTLQAAAAMDCIREITLLASPTALRKFSIPPYEKLRIVEMAKAESDSGRFLWAMRGLEQYLSDSNCDAFIGFTGICSTKKVVSLLAIHQTLPYSHESLRLCSWKIRMRMAVIRWLTRRAARAADHIFVQSEVVGDTISRAFGIPPGRISAFMPSSPLLPRHTAESPKLKALRSDLKSNVLLYVGSDAPHKNLSVVAQGLRRMPQSKQPKWYVTLPEDSPLCRQCFAIGLGTLNGAELYEAYQNATLLIMPSLIEIVGLPMLEAMRMGTPVLAADRPYAHAVCEDAAAFFDPLSPDDFAKQASRLLADAERRAVLIERGLALVRRRDAIDPYRAMMEKVVEVADAKTFSSR